MSAVRLARGYTGRDMLVKFEGCYHGHVDALMVSSGSGLATFGIASSPGIPQDTVATTLICPLDDLEAVEFLFSEHGDDIAAVVIEPLPANNGLLIQRPEFLRGLRRLCDAHGALLIFDEVISGFRFKEGSFGDLCGVTPDLTALGKSSVVVCPSVLTVLDTKSWNNFPRSDPSIRPAPCPATHWPWPLGPRRSTCLTRPPMITWKVWDLLEEEMNAVLEKHGNPMRLVRRGESVLDVARQRPTRRSCRPNRQRRCRPVRRCAPCLARSRLSCWRLPPTRSASSPRRTTKDTSTVSLQRWTMPSRTWS